MPNNTTFKGFLYGAIAASSYGLNPLFALPLYAEGMSPDSVLFFRYVDASYSDEGARMFFPSSQVRDIAAGSNGIVFRPFVIDLIRIV